MRKKEVKAGQFKAQCLQIMSEICRTQVPVIVTRRNEPLVKIVPIEEKKSSLSGALKGTVKITGDIIAPTGDEWDACH